MSLEIDFETQSDVDIRTRGVYFYMASPRTKPLFAWYKLNGAERKRWDASEPCPPEIVAHVEAGGTIKAHNAAFERLLWQRVLIPRYGWPKAVIRQFYCTAATAAALGLPRALGDLATALNLPVQKDKDGYRLIMKFSVPRKARKGEDPTGIYFNQPHEHPEDWKKFDVYGGMDVDVEAAADARMVPLSEHDQECYWRSEEINDRGIRIDTESALAALKLADKAKLFLNHEMDFVTKGRVKTCTQVEALTAWVQSRGVEMLSAAKAELEDLLGFEDIPPDVRRAIELRQEAAKTSVSKLTAFLQRVEDDSRIRGAFLFRAAGTGRYSSVGAQLHNLPRPRKEFGDSELDPRAMFEAFRQGSPHWLRFLYGDELGKTLWVLSDSIRGFLWAAPGHELLAADYSGIEGAVAAWFAGEDWKLRAMRDIIEDPKKPDLYRLAAAGIFNTTTDLLTKKDVRRQVGKVSELSLQYQGGVGAFRSMSRNYSLKIDPVYEPVWAAAKEWDERNCAPGEKGRCDRAEARYEECLKRKEETTQVMSRRAWIAAELVKVGWRATHPAIVGAWKALEDAMWEAVQSPGTVVSVLRAKYLVRNGFLWCMLPSGRCLSYGAPKIKEVVVPWADMEQPLEKQEKRLAVTALGVNSVTRKLERFALYGGLAFENVVQAIALDLLEHGIELADKAGYPVIGHVHDEIITEVPRSWGDLDEFCGLICQLPEWAEGLPLTAGGWRGKRYRKD